MNISTTIVGAICIGAAFFILSRQKSRNLPHPPGPQGYPLVGYLKTIPSPLWKTYLDWGKQYKSDIVRLNILGNNMIVTNTLKATLDLLDKRSAIHSDRPTAGLVMANELVGFGWSTASAPYGQYWRESRKLFQKTFGPHAVGRYRPVETTATHKLLRNLLETPKDFRKHIRYQVGTVIIRAAYGIEVQEKDDPYIVAAEHALWIANRCMEPGAWFVDLIPLLKYVPEWLPWAGFKRQANIWRKEIEAFVDSPFLDIKTNQNLPVDCAAKFMFENIKPDSSSIEYVESVVIKGTLSTMYAAGSDTTVSMLDTFFLAMTLCPEIQREAQESIDRACEGRLPYFSDYDALPLVHAIVQECLRWRPALPLTVPHMNTKDDVYDGYWIPKGSMVFANIRAILHDPATYTEPEMFNPKRFLKKATGIAADLELDLDVLDPGTVTFGFGRRACPGRWMVYESMWLVIASVLATFDITPTSDERGRPVLPEGKYTNSFISGPEEFACAITPRSSHHERLVLSASD